LINLDGLLLWWFLFLIWQNFIQLLPRNFK
jgi:hypothetical protein